MLARVVEQHLKLNCMGRATTVRTNKSFPLVSFLGIDFFVDGQTVSNSLNEKFTPAWSVAKVQDEEGRSMHVRRRQIPMQFEQKNFLKKPTLHKLTLNMYYVAPMQDTVGKSHVELKRIELPEEAVPKSVLAAAKAKAKAKPKSGARRATDVQSKEAKHLLS